MFSVKVEGGRNLARLFLGDVISNGKEFQPLHSSLRLFGEFRAEFLLRSSCKLKSSESHSAAVLVRVSAPTTYVYYESHVLRVMDGLFLLAIWTSLTEAGIQVLLPAMSSHSLNIVQAFRNFGPLQLQFSYQSKVQGVGSPVEPVDASIVGLLGKSVSSNPTKSRCTTWSNPRLIP